MTNKNVTEKRNIDEDWIPFNRGVQVNVYVIIKRRKGEFSKWDILEVESMKGDWHDLIYVLYQNYGQFKDDVAHSPSRAILYDKLDKIANEYTKKDLAYEFVLPDGTDDWYLAYVKPAMFRMDPDGTLQ